jgi:hypothetical protein
MRKQIKKSLLIVVLLGVFMLTACTSPTPEENMKYCAGETPEGFILHEDKDENFNLQYPENWTLESDTEDFYLSVLSPLENEEDTLQETLTLLVEELNDDELEADLTEAVDYAIEELKKEIDDFNLVSKEDTDLSGLNAKKIHYTWKNEDIKVDTQQVIAISKERKRQYILTFSNFAEGETKTDFEEKRDQMFASFCFTKEK